MKPSWGRVRIGAIAVATLALTALTATDTAAQVWPMFHHDSAHTGLSTVNTANNPCTLKCKYLTGGVVDGSPVISNDGAAVYVGSNDDYLYAINSRNCSLKWRFLTSGPIESAPAFSPGGNGLCAAANKPFPCCTGSKSGTCAGTIYVRNDAGDFYALVDAGTTAAQKWKIPSPNTGVTNNTFQFSSPVINPINGTIYGGSSGGDLDTTDGLLYSVSDQGLSGAVSWTFTVPPAPIAQIASNGVLSSPAVSASGSTIYFGCNDHKIYAVSDNGTSATQLWNYVTGDFVVSSPAIDSAGDIFAFSLDTYFYALTPSGDNLSAWPWLYGDSSHSSPAIGAAGTLYVGSASTDDALYAVNTNATERWALTTGNLVYSSPAIGGDGRIWVGSNDDNVYGATDGGQGTVSSCHFTTGGSIGFSSPAIGNDGPSTSPGTIWVGSADDNLYAINTSPTPTATATASPTVSATATVTRTATPSPTVSPSPIVSVTATATRTATATATPTVSATATATASPTPACSPGLAGTSINTGQGSVPPGDHDPLWVLRSDVNAHVTAPADAVVVSPFSGWNTTDFSSSQWISASTACGGGGNYLNCLGGPYVYQICWTQTGSGSVSLQFLADNDAAVCLNNPSCPPVSNSTVIGGSVIGYDNYLDPTNNFIDPALNTPSVTNAATSSGPNTLQVSVGNTTQTPSGLEVQGLLCGNVTLVACPTVSATATATASPTATATHTVTATPTASRTATATASATATATLTATATATPTPTVSATPTPTVSATPTAQPTVSACLSGQTPDHLKCYKIKDSKGAAAILSLDSPQFGVEPNCVVDGYATELCVPVCKTLISGPSPTGFVGHGIPDDLLCYSLKCTENNAPTSLGVEDQFAKRTVSPSKANMICAPAGKQPPAPCGGKTRSTCGGACPVDQACQWHSAAKGVASGCACVATTTACGNTTTNLCGGGCPLSSTGIEQACRDLGGTCLCTPF